MTTGEAIFGGLLLAVYAGVLVGGVRLLWYALHPRRRR
jgi:hypothetical protein